MAPAPGTGDPASVPWAWPALIRVTITLVDAKDASIRDTFQYVFDTPGNPLP